jgi:hypothetical protein
MIYKYIMNSLNKMFEIFIIDWIFILRVSLCNIIVFFSKKIIKKSLNLLKIIFCRYQTADFSYLN